MKYLRFWSISPRCWSNLEEFGRNLKDLKDFVLNFDDFDQNFEDFRHILNNVKISYCYPILKYFGQTLENFDPNHNDFGPSLKYLGQILNNYDLNLDNFGQNFKYSGLKFKSQRLGSKSHKFGKISCILFKISKVFDVFVTIS